MIDEDDKPGAASGPTLSDDAAGPSAAQRGGAGEGPVMPGERGVGSALPGLGQPDAAESAASAEPGAGGAGDGELPPPPSIGRQMAQLVVIPAVITIIALGLWLLFGSLAGRPDSLEDQLARLRQTSGYGRNLPAGAQDPRYKDRCLAAFNIAQQIGSIDDPKQKQWLSDELVQIHNDVIRDDEPELLYYVLTAIGQLGQKGGLDVILSRQGAEHELVRRAVAWGVLNWPDDQMARRGVEALIKLVRDQDPTVRTLAAAALGKLGRADDEGVIDGLREAMASAGREFRDARSNAAVALAVLGDARGARFVAETLLDRDALAKMGEEDGSDRRMSESTQDRVMIGTLASAPRIKSEAVWKKIRQIADNDPSPSVRKAAYSVLEVRDSQP